MGGIPWVTGEIVHDPNGVADSVFKASATPLGSWFFMVFTQGFRLEAATLGFKSESPLGTKPQPPRLVGNGEGEAGRKTGLIMIFAACPMCFLCLFMVGLGWPLSIPTVPTFSIVLPDVVHEQVRTWRAPFVFEWPHRQILAWLADKPLVV